MEEQIKQLIAQCIIAQGQINVVLRNLTVSGLADDEKISHFLDEKEKLENRITDLKVILKKIQK